MKKLNKKLFARFYWGISNDNERKEVFDSKESDEMLWDQWENYAEMKLVSPQPDHDKITRNINQKIARNNRQGNNQGIRFLSTMHYAAAGIVAFIVSAVLIYLLVYSPGSIDSIAMIEKENPRGQRSEHILPDGSKVWLNADSKIIYPEEFNNSSREVKLRGEAYFEVTKDKKPFLVKTDRIDIEVLGTEFNVMAYPYDQTITTTLVAGKVSVKRINPETQKIQKAVLTPNHQAIYHKTEERFILDQVDVLPYTSWIQGKLMFDKTPLIEIVKTLERWYGVEILLQKKLDEQYCYTLTITDESIKEVMNLIQKTTPGINITIHDQSIEISKN
ncbi:MAG: FecR domain-containing protein [Bacteroidales bacterium]|jgi:ferric-dicitrate binding protein FerR (iron transport regulator)|nr:FecR domain-containing protein [Bacteroidales bacterium]